MSTTITVRSAPERTGTRSMRGIPPRRSDGFVARAVSALTSPGVVSWVAVRVAILAALALARFLVAELGAEDPTGRPPSGLVGWDAVWYVRIIESGYRHLPWESLRFFPLLPLLAKVLSPAFGARVALLVVVNIASLGAGILIERLARHETADPALASRAAWFLAFFPAAFVLVMGYAESLLLVFALATFLALRRQRWGLAALMGLLAGLSRPLGAVLVIPAVIEACRGVRRARPRERSARLAAAIAPGIGGIVYLTWSWVSYGDPLRPLRLQQEFDRRGEFRDPVSSLVQAARQLAAGTDLGSGLHFPWAIAFLMLLVVCFRRWPASYGAFAGAVLLVALSAGNLDSLERYGLSAFPLVLALATAARPAWLERATLSLAATGFVVYATLAFLGAYVP